jgi:hypothetical protein
MNLKQRLTEKKPDILKAWQEAVQQRPAGASVFPTGQSTLAAATTGYTFEQGLDALFDALLQGVIPGDVSRFLDDMIRIRAVNDISASRSVEFILAIKKIVRNVLGSGILDDKQEGQELASWDAVVDELVLFAFDSYVRHRESVLELKADEAKEKTLRLLKKAKLIPDDQDNL